MRNFHKFEKSRDNRGSGGGHFSGGRFGGGGRKFGGHGGSPRPMYPATCSRCGQNCEVPFKPTGERPVFCKKCFQSQGGPGPRFAPKSFSGGRGAGQVGSQAIGIASGPASSGVAKAQFDSLNAKLDKILAMLAATKAAETSPVAGLEIKNKKPVAKKITASAKKSRAKKK